MVTRILESMSKRGPEGEDDDAPYSEHRKITGVVWENRAGWKMLTELVRVPGETKKQSYMVNAPFIRL